MKDVWASSQPRISPAGLAFVIALHVLLFWGLWQMRDLPVLAPLKTLTVQILAPEAPHPEPKREEPVKELPKPLPMQKKPKQPQEPQLLAAPTPQAEAATVEARPPQPLPDIAPPAPPAPPALSEPRFDADYLDNPRPVYPALSKRMGEQGKVILRVHVSAEGKTTEVQIRTSSGYERLDQSAVNAVRQWRFTPARRGDESVAAWVLVPITFNLKES